MKKTSLEVKDLKHYINSYRNKTKTKHRDNGISKVPKCKGNYRAAMAPASTISSNQSPVLFSSFTDIG